MSTSASQSGARDPALEAALAAAFGISSGAYREEPLPQHASTRSYARLVLEAPPPGAPESLVVMRLSGDPLASDEGSSADRPPELPFVAVASLLRERGVPVPAVHHVDLGRGLLLLEDLGRETFEDRLLAEPEARWETRYAEAVDVLAHMHGACAELPEASLPRTRRFDRALLRWELDHFREWGLEALHGPLPDEDRAIMDGLFDRLADELATAPEGFVHRDYQSRNLMWAPNDRLTVIDFQDALTGPRVYDLVALLCDSYVALPLALQDAMIARYAERQGLVGPEARSLVAEFWRQALQRKLKDAGRFVFIDRERKNPSFLRWYPQSLVYVGRALARTPGYEALEAVLRRHLPGFPDTCLVPASTVDARPVPAARCAE